MSGLDWDAEFVESARPRVCIQLKGSATLDDIKLPGEPISTALFDPTKKCCPVGTDCIIVLRNMATVLCKQVQAIDIATVLYPSVQCSTECNFVRHPCALRRVCHLCHVCPPHLTCACCFVPPLQTYTV